MFILSMSRDLGIFMVRIEKMSQNCKFGEKNKLKLNIEPAYLIFSKHVKQRSLHGIFVITLFISPRLQYRTEGSEDSALSNMQIAA